MGVGKSVVQGFMPDRDSGQEAVAEVTDSPLDAIRTSVLDFVQTEAATLYLDESRHRLLTRVGDTASKLCKGILLGDSDYHMLLLGPSGCGKTSLLRLASRACASALSEAHTRVIDIDLSTCDGIRLNGLFHYVATQIGCRTGSEFWTAGGPRESSRNKREAIVRHLTREGQPHARVMVCLDHVQVPYIGEGNWDRWQVIRFEREIRLLVEHDDGHFFLFAAGGAGGQAPDGGGSCDTYGLFFGTLDANKAHMVGWGNYRSYGDDVSPLPRYIRPHTLNPMTDADDFCLFYRRFAPTGELPNTLCGRSYLASVYVHSRCLPGQILEPRKWPIREPAPFISTRAALEEDRALSELAYAVCAFHKLTCPPPDVPPPPSIVAEMTNTSATDVHTYARYLQCVPPAVLGVRLHSQVDLWRGLSDRGVVQVESHTGNIGFASYTSFYDAWISV